MATNAPNAATKKIQNAVVTVLKCEAGAKSLPKLEAYITANRAQWINGSIALVEAIVSCASSL